jgi:hypothetical protein
MCQAWWLTPAIQAAQEGVYGGSQFEAIPDKKLVRPHLNQ